MDNKYQNGKIYKLVCDKSPLVYYGSTIKPLSRRLVQHKSHIDCSSRELFELGNVSIELVEEYPCNNKKELEARERIYIEFMLNNFNHKIICNKVIPGRTRAEYRLDNKDSIKDYYKANRDSFKDYYKANKEVISEREREKIKCDCGSIINRNSKSRHIKSKKHLAYVSVNSNKAE